MTRFAATFRIFAARTMVATAVRSRPARNLDFRSAGKVVGESIMRCSPDSGFEQPCGLAPGIDHFLSWGQSRSTDAFKIAELSSSCPKITICHSCCTQRLPNVQLSPELEP